MPWKLVPPHTRKDGKVIRFYYVQGTYLGIKLDDSTGTAEERAAKRIFATWKKQAERGEFRKKEEPAKRVTMFEDAALAYMRAGGDGSYLDPIVKKWRGVPVLDIDQIMIDLAAEEVYPGYPPTTKNRQFYTPAAAVLHHGGSLLRIKRPKGWRGKKSKWWLEKEQAFALFREAYQIDPEFGLFCEYLCYTGERLGEALRAKLGELKLDRAFLYLSDSKNDEPRGIHITPYLIDQFRAQPPRKVTEVLRNEWGEFLTGRPLEDAGVPFLERSPKAKLFRFHKGGALRDMLALAMHRAGLSFPPRYCGFHLFCHTYGSWMNRREYGDLDNYALARTGRWKDPKSTEGYIHTQASEEAMRADLLPTPKDGQLLDINARRA